MLTHEEEAQLLKMVRDFADSELRPVAAQFEEEGKDPADLYRQAGTLGLAGLPFDPKYGGGGAGYLTYLKVIEELARSWASFAVGIGVHTLCCDGIQRYGSEALKDELLPGMLAGEKFGAYALTESSSGSDAAALRSTAVASSGAYTLNGTKQFCTRGAEADHVLVMARTDGPGARGISAFIVDQGTPGFRPSKKERKMGWNASPTWELVLDSLHVPAGRRLAQEGDGFKVALSALDAGRLGIAAEAIGLAQAAVDASIKFTKEREQFGARVIDFQGLSFMLADMATAIEAGRALYRHAARLKDAGEPYSIQAAMSKLFCTDTAMKVTTDAVQLHGGYGYIEEYPVERFMREAKGLQIVEGTNQIQRMIIGRHLSA